VNKATEWRW